MPSRGSLTIPLGALLVPDAFAAWLLDQPLGAGALELPALVEMAMLADSCRPNEDPENALRLRRPLAKALASMASPPPNASPDAVAATLREGVAVLDPTTGIVGLPNVSTGAAVGRIMRAPEEHRAAGLLALRWAVELQSAACIDPAVPELFRRAHAAEAAEYVAKQAGLRERDVLYGEQDGVYLLLAPRDDAAEIRAVRQQLAKCTTWSDTRRVLSPGWHQRLVDECGPANGEDRLHLPTNLSGEPWPFLNLHVVPKLVPYKLLRRFGERFDGVAGYGWNLPLERADDLIAALEAAGATCTEDPDLEGIFADDL